MAGGNATPFTICSICSEDLKPIIDDLQSISVCGHIFHQMNFNSSDMAELSLYKEQCQVEQTLKNEALKQNAAIQQVLHLKSEALHKSSLECTRLQESNMALAKELASLKIASDVNLSENEMLKLASLGNDANSKETNRILIKSLMICNKNYMKLMNKCKGLGKGEAVSLRKLEKANEKINKLKVRIQGLELGIEVIDNIALRNLEASKQATNEVNTFNSFDQASKISKGKSFTLETSANQAAECNILSSSTKKRKHDDLKDTNMQKIATDGNYENKKTSEACKKAGPMDHCNDIHVPDAKPATKANVMAMPDPKNGKVKHPQECINLDQPVLSVRNEVSSAHIVSQPGPGGTNSHSGKLCKKSKQLMLGSSVRNGDLIVVGGEGRGGKIKSEIS